MTQPDAIGDGWQPISTAPRDGTEIIIFVVDEQTVTCAYWSCWVDDPAQGFWEGVGGNHFYVGDVSHWMPLPNPPASSQAE